MCEEGFYHIEEFKEHKVLLHKDTVNLVSITEGNENVVKESRDKLGHTYSDTN